MEFCIPGKGKMIDKSILIMLDSLVLIALFAIKIKKDKIDTSSITAIRSLIAITMAYWVAMVVSLGYYILKLEYESSSAIIFAFFMAFGVSFLFSLTYTFLNAPRILSRNMKLRPADEIIREKAKSLSQELGVKRHVDIQISANIAIPQVFEGWNRKAVVVIPEDLDELIDGFMRNIDHCSATRLSRDEIQSYLLLHEISHIRNGDAFFRQFIQLMSRYSAYFLVVMLISLSVMGVLELFTGITHISYLYIFAFISMIAPCLIFLGSHKILLRISEYLADARAAQYMSPETVRELTDRLSHNRSALEILFDLLSTMHKIRAEKHRFVQREHPNVYERIDALKGISHAMRFPNYKVFAMIGVWFALESGSGLWLNRIGIDAHIISNPAIFGNWLLAVSFAMMFSLPWKNLIDSPTGEDYVGFTLRLMGYHFLSFVLFFLVFTPIGLCVAYYNEVPDTIRIITYSLQYSISIHTVMFVCAIAFTVLFGIVDKFEKTGMSLDTFEFGNLIIITLSAIVPGAITFLTISSVGPKIQFNCMICFFMGFCIFRIAIAAHGLGESGLYLIQIRRKIIILDPVRSSLSWHITAMLFGLIFGAMYFVIPIALGYIIYIAGYSHWLRIQGLSRLFLFNLFALFAGITMIGYGNPRGSMFELRAKTMMDINVPKEKRTKLSELLNGIRHGNGSYVSGQTRLRRSILGTMKRTNVGIIIYKLINKASDDAAINWVLSLESIDGGFPVIEDTAPRLESTFLALEALYEVNHLNSIRYRVKHVSFVLNHRDASEGFASTDMKKSTLKATFQAIASLYMLDVDKSAIEGLKDCAKWIFSEWEKIDSKNRPSFEETYHLVYCLQWLEEFEGERMSKITEYWLPIHENMLFGRRPDMNYDKVYYYIKLLDLLGLRRENRALKKIGNL